MIPRGHIEGEIDGDNEQLWPKEKLLCQAMIEHNVRGMMDREI